jgi:trans-aconitate methyltransferase
MIDDMKKITRCLLVFCLAFTFLMAEEGISEAGAYRKNSDIQWQLAMENLADFDFERNDFVLDVGCGDGKITNVVAELVPEGKVVGLDISEKMIAEASRLFKRDHLIFLRGNAANIPFYDRFDKVISFNTLHWVLEQEKALQSIYNSLKVGGSVLLIVPGKFANNSGLLGEKLARSDKWSSHFPEFKRQRAYYTAEEYVVLLNKAGFQIETFKILEGTADYKDRDALVAWIAPLMNYTSHLPEDLRREFVEDMADEMLLIDPPAPDGKIRTRYIMFRIIAKKVVPTIALEQMAYP